MPSLKERLRGDRSSAAIAALIESDEKDLAAQEARTPDIEQQERAAIEAGDRGQIDHATLNLARHHGNIRELKVTLEILDERYREAVQREADDVITKANADARVAEQHLEKLLAVWDSDGLRFAKRAAEMKVLDAVIAASHKVCAAAGKPCTARRLHELAGGSITGRSFDLLRETRLPSARRTGDADLDRDHWPPRSVPHNPFDSGAAVTTGRRDAAE